MESERNPTSVGFRNKGIFFFFSLILSVVAEEKGMGRRRREREGDGGEGGWRGRAVGSLQLKSKELRL